MYSNRSKLIGRLKSNLMGYKYASCAQLKYLIYNTNYLNGAHINDIEDQNMYALYNEKKLIKINATNNGVI